MPECRGRVTGFPSRCGYIRMHESGRFSGEKTLQVCQRFLESAELLFGQVGELIHVEAQDLPQLRRELLGLRRLFRELLDEKWASGAGIGGGTGAGTETSAAA